MSFCTPVCSHVTFQSEADGFAHLHGALLPKTIPEAFGRGKGYSMLQMQRCTVVSAWLCVAKRLHRLAACLSAGHRSSPDTPPTPSTSPPHFIRPSIIHPPLPSCPSQPQRHNSHLFPLAKSAIAWTVSSTYSNAALPFIRSSIHPSTPPHLIAPCGNRVIWELGDTSVFLFFPFHPHVWRDFSQFWPCLPVFFH